MSEPSKSAMTEAWRIYFERCDTVPIAHEFEETEVIDLIARAIDAAKAEEREACAAHLESEAKASPLGHESVQRGRSTYNWLAYCADLIRKRAEVNTAHKNSVEA